MCRQVQWALRRKQCGTLARETRQNPPAWVTRISYPLKSNSSNHFSTFVLLSALASGGLGPRQMPLSCQSILVAPAPMWPQLLLPWGSSSLESGDTPNYFSLLGMFLAVGWKVGGLSPPRDAKMWLFRDAGWIWWSHQGHDLFWMCYFTPKGCGPCLSSTKSDRCRVASYLVDLQATKAH